MSEDKFNEADYYEKDSSTQRKDGHKIIDILAPKKGMKILDLGCGTGYFSKTFADLVGPDGQVVGVDPDGERIKVALRKYTASNLEYIEGGIKKISDSDFDIVFANHVFHWIKDKDLVLKQVSHCLKKGGRYALLGLSYSTLFAYVSVNSESQELKQRIKERYFPILEEDFKPMLISNGFQINHWEIGGNSWITDGLDAFIISYMTHFGAIERDHFQTLKNYDHVTLESSDIFAVMTKW